ncbi:hypothetical protein PAPYR_490 [Paratrimastix pyriformis]|uniref:Sm domain-containing protein n=1 Tax=Paratrimastix pyriformis TaxID=342808 RepID=A0ABQ8UUJ1_9EUKA|nr:hypothetical protein PAPYR_490 [Paratrimastix pyriformis]
MLAKLDQEEQARPPSNARPVPSKPLTQPDKRRPYEPSAPRSQTPPQTRPQSARDQSPPPLPVPTPPPQPSWDFMDALLAKDSLQRGPFSLLAKWFRSRARVKICLRGPTNYRGFLVGTIEMFDKHWNLVLTRVAEVTWPYAPVRPTITPEGRTHRPRCVTVRRMPQIMVRGEQVICITEFMPQGRHLPNWVGPDEVPLRAFQLT